jgi:iron-sulfur cluster repair protein YtfE (RIC family)
LAFLFVKRREKMNTITQPLSDEHRELLKHIESLRLTGDMIVDTNLTTPIQRGIEEAFDFLAHDLIPHALAEDKVLYPIVQRIMGSPHATETMSRDHMAVSNLTRELGYMQSHISGHAITAEQAAGLRRVIYGLYTLVKTHFDKEEEVYMPLLEDNLKPDEASKMMDALEAAARMAKSEVPAMLEGFQTH